MRKITTLLFTFIMSFCVASFAQESNLPDEGMPYTITDPKDIQVYDSGPLEEVFGSQQNSFGPLGTRGRGNLFTCTTDRIITEHRLFLNLTAASPLWFCIYEGETAVGTYNQLSAVLVSNQGPGQGWYSSGPIDVTLQAGKFYLIYTQWDATANYYTQNPVTPYPFPCSFGELTAGAGWHGGSVPAYGNPPPATQTITAAAFGDPVAYYQTIVSTVIPVELVSFTASVTDKKVNLNWITATETNNYGFEVERKTANEDFSVIGFVEGHGTVTENRYYSFFDDKVTSGAYTYRLRQIDFDGTFEYSFEVEVDVNVPNVYSLEQNYPNPFNPSTKINFNLASESKVTLKIFDVLGQEVATLVNGNLPAQSHSIDFDASSLNSGVYFYTIEAAGADGNSFVNTKKMILTK